MKKYPPESKPREKLPIENFFKNKKRLTPLIILIPVLLGTIFLDYELKSPSTIPDYKLFFISKGDSFASIVDRLSKENLIRSPIAFELTAFLTGSSGRILPGRYELSPHLSGFAIIKEITNPGNGEVKIVVPEGLTVFEVDKILSDQKIIASGELVKFSQGKQIEGKLFPDTYKFSVGSKVEDVVRIFLDNFNQKAGTLLGRDLKNFETNLIAASIIQKEVPDSEEQKVVAGIFKKRVESGMPLQVDASICYIKRQNNPNSGNGCYPLTPVDFKIDSPYNTYLHKGWPPGPISSPGLSAITATLEPKASLYWFYLSDPATGKTVFSESFAEHKDNISIFLRS